MDQQNKTDALEILIISAMFLLIVVVYVPVAIWEDESFYQNESRYRMQNMNDIQTFYKGLTGEYSAFPLKAMKVVNAVRDSTIADSLYARCGFAATLRPCPTPLILGTYTSRDNLEL